MGSYTGHSYEKIYPLSVKFVHPTDDDNKHGQMPFLSLEVGDEITIKGKTFTVTKGFSMPNKNHVGMGGNRSIELREII